jgi:hypothetical protein
MKKPISKRSKEYQRGYRAGYAKAMRAGLPPGYKPREKVIVIREPVSRPITQEERDWYAEHDTRMGGVSR